MSKLAGVCATPAPSNPCPAVPAGPRADRDRRVAAARTLRDLWRVVPLTFSGPLRVPGGRDAGKVRHSTRLKSTAALSPVTTAVHSWRG